jgi:hypothetical protein
MKGGYYDEALSRVLPHWKPKAGMIENVSSSGSLVISALQFHPWPRRRTLPEVNAATNL